MVHGAHRHSRFAPARSWYPWGVAARAVCFDMMGTIFDLTPARRRLQALGAPAVALEAWFGRTLHAAASLTLAAQFRPFPEIAEAMLRSVLAQLELDPGGAGSVLESLGELDPIRRPAPRSRASPTAAAARWRSRTAARRTPAACSTAPAWPSASRPSSRRSRSAPTSRTRRSTREPSRRSASPPGRSRSSPRTPGTSSARGRPAWTGSGSRAWSASGRCRSSPRARRRISPRPSIYCSPDEPDPAGATRMAIPAPGPPAPTTRPPLAAPAWWSAAS